ncbi:MAG: hypothetical protein ACTHLN_14175, partial [Tepidisphaeraceae bacterium]
LDYLSAATRRGKSTHHNPSGQMASLDVEVSPATRLYGMECEIFSDGLQVDCPETHSKSERDLFLDVDESAPKPLLLMMRFLLRHHQEPETRF